jgi:hypothetical protein
MKTSLRVTRQRIVGYGIYRKLDPETFDFIAAAYSQRASHIVANSRQVQAAFPTLEKIFWRPDRREFERKPNGPQSSIQVSEWIHEGIHQLFYDRFGKKSFTDPTLSLMAEGTATAVDLHFWLLLAADQGWNAKQFCSYYNIKVKPRTRESALLEMQISQYSNPAHRVEIFNSFQRSMADYFYELNELFVRNKLGRPVSAISLDRLMTSSDSKWLPLKFDFSNFILFVHAYGDRAFSKTSYQRRISRARTAGNITVALSKILK